MKKLNKMILVAAVASISVGCSNTTKTPTQKEAAKKEWNQARAGVMSSLARDQFQSGNFDKARSTVDEALRSDPENAGLYILSARIAIEQDSIEQASQNLATARKLAPNDAEALYLSGIVSQRWQKYEEAFGYYSLAADASPSELAYLMAKAETLILLNRSSEAMALLNSKLAYFDHSAAIRDAVAQMLMQRGKTEEAADLFRQASVLSPKDFGIKERLATAQFRSNAMESAAETISTLVAHPDYVKRGDLFAMLGECRLQEGRAVEARVAFQKATELNPGDTDAWLGTAKALLLVGDLGRAESFAKRAVALAPERSDCQLVLGYAYLKQDQLAEAQVTFDAAAKLDPTDSVSLCMAGQVRELKGDRNGALELYGKALRLNPKDELAAQLLAAVRVDD